MATFTLPTIDDLSRDYESIRDTFIALIPTFTDEWTSIPPSDPGIVLLQLASHGFDVLHFETDRKSRQNFLIPSSSRKAVINLLKLIDFQLRSASPAKVDLVFTLGQVQAVDVTIPKGTKIRTQADEVTPAVSFETDADLVITIGKLGNEKDGQGNFTTIIGATEGTSGTETAGTSDGTTSFQEFPLVSVPIIDGTLQVFVDEGVGEVLWTEVSSFADSLPADEVYTVSRDEADRITIRFGDNANGKIPVTGAVIRTEFRTGGGSVGNVGADTIKIVESTIFSAGEPITVSVTNPNNASGGEGRETIAEAKRLGPLSLRALGRAVSPQDYKTLAEQRGGVAKARVVPGFLPFEVDAFIVPEGGGDPSQALLDDIEAFLEGINPVGTIVTTKAPTFVDIEITGIVTVLPNFQNAIVKTAVLLALTNFFDEGRLDVDFGKDVRISDIFRLIDETDGVDHVEFTRFTRTPEIVFGVKSGDYTVGAITISKETKDETWTIRFTNTTDFTAEGSTSGLQTATGSLDAQYTSDDQEVSFLVSAGTKTPKLGDNFTFKTSPLVASVLLSDDEFPFLPTTDNIIFTGGAD